MPEPGLDDLLAQAGQNDPRTMLLLNALRQASERAEARAGTQTEIETLRAQAGELARANDALRRRLAAVAAALGGCPRCLGEASGCPACGGDGVPGALRPDSEAFARYVVPAVQRARRSSTRRSPETGPTTEVS